MKDSLDRMLSWAQTSFLAPRLIKVKPLLLSLFSFLFSSLLLIIVSVVSFVPHEQSNDGNQKLFFASVCPVHAGAGESTPAAGFKYGAEADPQGK